MNIKKENIKPVIKIFRSNRYIYAQVLDKGNIIESASSLKEIKDKNKKITKTEQSKNVGISLAKKLLKKKINTAVVSRGKYIYIGRIKSLVEGLREGGLKI
jgi:large subunit ribosomal protein L18